MSSSDEFHGGRYYGSDPVMVAVDRLSQWAGYIGTILSVIVVIFYKEMAEFFWACVSVSIVLLLLMVAGKLTIAFRSGAIDLDGSKSSFKAFGVGALVSAALLLGAVPVFDLPFADWTTLGVGTLLFSLLGGLTGSSLLSFSKAFKSWCLTMRNEHGPFMTAPFRWALDIRTIVAITVSGFVLVPIALVLLS